MALLSLSILAALPHQAAAWRDEGHKAIAPIAEHYLTPEARKQVDSLLAADTDPLTQYDIANEATWGRQVARQQSPQGPLRRDQAVALR
jgi:S1/P1 Nuclease